MNHGRLLSKLQADTGDNKTVDSMLFPSNKSRKASYQEGNSPLFSCTFYLPKCLNNRLDPQYYNLLEIRIKSDSGRILLFAPNFLVQNHVINDNH